LRVQQQACFAAPAWTAQILRLLGPGMKPREIDPGAIGDLRRFHVRRNARLHLLEQACPQRLGRFEDGVAIGILLFEVRKDLRIEHRRVPPDVLPVCRFEPGIIVDPGAAELLDAPGNARGDGGLERLQRRSFHTWRGPAQRYCGRAGEHRAPADHALPGPLMLLLPERDSRFFNQV
jgi:hypothetical protein